MVKAQRNKNAVRRKKTTTPSASASTDAARTTEGLVPTSTRDYLTVDDPIIGQQFVCMSFVSPKDDVLPRKDAFFFQKYVDEIFRSKVQGFTEAVQASPGSAQAFTQALLEDVSDVSNDLAAFLSSNQVRLNDLFSELNSTQLTTSGFKVRGCFPDITTAKRRAELLQRLEPHLDVFVAQVGAWCPFNPSAESIGDVVYDETELNTLMMKKKEAEDAKSSAYADSTSTRIEKTRRDGAGPSGRALDTVPEETESADEEEDEEEVVDIAVADADADAEGGASKHSDDAGTDTDGVVDWQDVNNEDAKDETA